MITSHWGWTTPTYRQDPWYSAVVSLFDHVDSTVSVVQSMTTRMGWHTQVVSFVTGTPDSATLLDGTFRVVSYDTQGPARGFFTVTRSGLQVLAEPAIYTDTGLAGDTAASSYYADVFLRLMTDGAQTTPHSIWRHSESAGRTPLSPMMPVVVMSLGLGVHSWEMQSLGRFTANGWADSGNTYYAINQVDIYASEVWLKRPYPEVVMVNSPGGYWRLGEATGVTTATDYVGSFHGAYTNTCTRVPRPGLLQSDGADGCMYVSGIDGTADYVECGRASSLQMTGRQAFTVTGIFRPESVAGSVRGYIIGTGSGASATAGAGWNVSLINGALTFLRLDGATFEGGNITATSLIVPNSNHWFAITFTGSIATAWFRGVAVGSLTGLSFSLATTSNFAMGARVGFIAATGFRGGLDELSISSGVMADAQLRAQYAASVVDGT